MSAYYVSTRERQREKAMAYQKENRDATILRSRTWYKTNSDRAKASRREFYARNKEQVKQQVREWGSKNPDRRRLIGRNATARRRAAEILAVPVWANAQKIREYYFAADFLGMVAGEWHHVDHIVPLQSKLVCGLHNEFNLRVILGSENQSKGNRFWPDMP